MDIQLTFRQIVPTLELESQIFKEARRLERVCPQQLTWCHVVIDQPHRHRHGGQPYRVRVVLQGGAGYRVAGSELGVDVVHETVCAAVINAFRAIRSRLRSKAQVRGKGTDQGWWSRGEEAPSWA